MPLREGFLTNEGVKKGHPLKKALFYRYWQSNVKMVADRHRYTACHNKHWRQAF